MRVLSKSVVYFTVAVACGTCGAARADVFTYTYYPSDGVIDTAVPTDFAVIGYSGGRYNEDTLAREFTGASSPTVQFADGAVIASAEIFNHSVVNATGGAWTADLYDHSTLNVLGGVNGIGQSALGFESSVINVHGGRMGYIGGQGAAVNVYGGAVGTLEANSRTTFMGDNLGSCIAEVYGGLFEAGGNLSALNDGVLNLRGGTIQSDFVRAAEGGTLNIYGTNLTATLLDGRGANGYSIYKLSGLLADGSSIDGLEMLIRNDGVTYGHSTFNLIEVPAPAAGGLLVAAGLFASRRRRGGPGR
ncbi:MAG: hypothetical protein U0573_03160 [Phycisphaerales bacterium]|nr:hypothetical protein [Planctomycetota bacterium]